MAAGFYDITNETLGKGHFAVVKLARHCSTGELVAVKIIDKLRLKNENLKPLGQEIRILSRLSEKEHPNIVKLYHVIDTKFKLYLVMEYCGRDVCDLYDFIQKHNQGNGIRDSEARHIFRQICSAIAYCHSMRIVHRDLKPENILIVNKPEDHDGSDFIQYPLVKLIDFGFSNQWKEGEKLRTSCGSLAYSAPEILLGEHYEGDKVDIWGLGCILYILLYGSNPFMQINDSETLIKILDCNYNAPQRPNVNEKAIDLIKCLLRKEPNSRLTVQQILEHAWLAEIVPNADSFQAAIPSIPASDVSSTNSSVTDLRTCVTNSEDADLLELKRKLGKVKCEQDKERALSSCSSSSRSFLHDKVIEYMLAQSMCDSREQVEMALKKSRDFANRAPAKFVKQAENDENSNHNAINQNTNPTNHLTCNAVLIHNFNDNKLINEQITSNAIPNAQVPNATINNVDKPLNQDQDAYLTATYNLLKDKLFREHHGISITNQVLSKTAHHKKVLPNRPRKTVSKPPQFGLSTLRTTTEEETENSDTIGSTSTTNGNDANKGLEIPFEDESGYILPLARKCSIVSEEGSCVGTDLSFTEYGSDSVLDLNHSNFNSLSNENDNEKCLKRQASSGPRSSAPMTFPSVDIIVTDCCEYDEEKLKKLEEDQNLFIIQTHEEVRPNNEQHDSNENEENHSTSDKISDKIVDDQRSNDHQNIVTRDKCYKSHEAEFKSETKTNELSLINQNLHLASSSPDLLHGDEYKRMTEEQTDIDSIIACAARQEEHQDQQTIRSHLKSQNRNMHKVSMVDVDFDPVLSKRQYFPGSNLLRTSIRIITQSKSCNNILLDESEDNDTKGSSRKSSRRTWSWKKNSKKASSAVADSEEHKTDVDNSPNTDSESKMASKANETKKNRDERLECCNLC